MVRSTGNRTPCTRNRAIYNEQKQNYMSKKNLSLTPFARLFLVLLIAGPLSYLGASYYNGEDGIQNIKDMVGIGQESESKQTTTDSESSYLLEAENKELRKKIETLETENEALEMENEALRKQSEQ
jgi:cell division protein FtsB